MTPLKKAAIDLLDVLAKNKLISPAPFACFAIGIVIQADNIQITGSNLLTCELHSLRMQE